jgi:hypothetical protein
MNRIGQTDLDVFPLRLGGNVFGRTANEPTSGCRFARDRAQRDRCKDTGVQHHW